MAGLVEIMPDTGGIIGQDIDATLNMILHDETQLSILGLGLQILVQDKTPVDTGALFDSIQYESQTDVDDPELLTVFADEGPQIMEWSRVYVEYQEGGILGTATYTNPPHEMFELTSEGDGVYFTEGWALDAIGLGLAMCIAGAGVPL